MCVVVTVIFGVCNFVRVVHLLVVTIRKVVTKSNIQSKSPSTVTVTRDIRYEQTYTSDSLVCWSSLHISVSSQYFKTTWLRMEGRLVDSK
jgi:hypothetical protein